MAAPDGALLVYDITDAESFKRVEAWVTELREQVKEGISIIIAGNKCDLEKNRNVNKAEAEAYATSHLGAPDCTSLHPTQAAETSSVACACFGLCNTQLCQVSGSEAH